MKSVPLSDRPVPSTVRRNWTEELATQFWGEDDATTVFANPMGSDPLPGAPARELARKLRPRGRPRDLRPRRPGPRSPGFAGVWRAADAVPEAPPPPRRIGRRLVVGLAIFGLGLGAGRLLLEQPPTWLRLAGAPDRAARAAGTQGAPASTPVASAASTVDGRPASPGHPSGSALDRPSAPARRRHRAPTAATRRLETAEASNGDSAESGSEYPKSIVKVDELDLTLPDPPAP